MTEAPLLWVVAAFLGAAVWRGARAARYIWVLYDEERRRDTIRRRIGGPEPPTRRILGWLRWLTTGIALAGAYFAGAVGYRILTGNATPSWLQPISAAVVVGLLLSGDYIASRLRKLEDEGRLDRLR